MKRRRRRPPEPAARAMGPPPGPTGALPGSAEKIAVLAGRAASRKELHVGGDVIADPSRALSWRRAGNTFVVDGVVAQALPDSVPIGTISQEESFGDRLARLRGRARLSRKQAAARVGVRPPVLCRWENGDRYPCYHALVKLADVLAVGLDELCGRRLVVAG